MYLNAFDKYFQYILFRYYITTKTSTNHHIFFFGRGGNLILEEGGLAGFGLCYGLYTLTSSGN